MVGAEWIGRLSDDAIIEEVGRGAFERGLDYADGGAVRSAAIGPDGGVRGVVSGSARAAYLVRIRHIVLHGDERFSGQCTCPMMIDCKHVAATLIVARRELRPAAPSWERVLGQVLEEPQQVRVPAVADAALHLRLHATPGAWGGPRARLQARPLRRGRSGKWIKTGISWQQVSHSQVPEVNPTHVVAMQSLWRAVQAGRSGYGLYGDTEWIDVTAAPEELWALVAACAETGVTILSEAAPEVPLRLVTPPGRLVLDLRADAEGARLEPLVELGRVPDGAGGDPADPALVRVEPDLWVGSPPHGWARQAGDVLEVGALSEPADPGVARLLGQPLLRVPAESEHRFLTEFAPALRRRVELVSSDASVVLPEHHPPRLALHVRHAARHTSELTWSMVYAVPAGGDARLPLLPTSTGPTGLTVTAPVPAGVVRDEAAETDLLARLGPLDALPQLTREHGGRRVPVERASVTGHETRVLVQEVLPRLERVPGLDIDVEGEPAAYRLVEDVPVVSVSARDSSDNDWFDLGVRVTVGSEEVPFQELFVALARGDDHLLLDSGTWFALERAELVSLRRLIEEARGLQDRPGDPLRLRPLHAGLWEELVSLGVVTEQSERWRSATATLLGHEPLPTPDVPSGLRATLRPYQVEGFHWLTQLWRLGLGGILADDMGLGKTVQTLALLQHAHETGGLDGPVLIVAPTSVLDTWAREAARFTPDLRVVIAGETTRRRGSPLPAVAAGAQVVVTSYAIFRIDSDAFARMPWAALVLDEAQAVKNHHAKAYACARRVRAPFKLAITGTPLENSLMDLWSLLSIVAPGALPGPDRFTELYRKPIEAGSPRPRDDMGLVGPDAVSEAVDRLASLRRRLKPLMLRRTKELVAKELPPKQEQVLRIALPRSHRATYDRHLQRERQRVLRLIDDDFSAHRFGILRALTTMRLLALHPALVDDQAPLTPVSAKVEALVEQLVEIAAEGHRALVFSQFTSYLAMVRTALDEAGVGYGYLDGSTRHRPAVIQAWRESDQPAFLISLKAGGVGLTLTEADYVFMMDPWWNPAVENQAIDRAHRIGQDKTVMVYRLVSADTIEERVLALQDRKRELFATVVDDGALASAALTADDIRGLLGD